MCPPTLHIFGKGVADDPQCKILFPLGCLWKGMPTGVCFVFMNDPHVGFFWVQSSLPPFQFTLKVLPGYILEMIPLFIAPVTPPG